MAAGIEETKSIVLYSGLATVGPVLPQTWKGYQSLEKIRGESAVRWEVNFQLRSTTLFSPSDLPGLKFTKPAESPSVPVILYYSI
jgi:hypothetical protein